MYIKFMQEKFKKLLFYCRNRTSAKKEQHVLFTIITGVKNQGGLQTC